MKTLVTQILAVPAPEKSESDALMMNASTTDKATKILIVDDDHDIRSLLSDILTNNGLEVSQAEDGKAMWDVLQSRPIDLIVLDLNLPEVDGLTLCRQLREISNLPVIMLTAKTNPLERVIGLETGADDYVCKPFEPLELLSRIRSVLRRSKSTQDGNEQTKEPEKITFAGWALDLTGRHLVNPQGVIISLSGAEYRLLRIFLDHPNRVLSRDQLMDFIHGRDASPFDRSIDLQVSRLRQRIEGDTKSPSIIKTVRNEGYVLTAKVEVVKA
jgi:two-component system OmpR family response regulator